MDKEKVKKYISFLREEYSKKLDTLDVVKYSDKRYMLIGAAAFMDVMLKNIENGEFD